MALDKIQVVHAAFLDLSKAYDHVSMPTFYTDCRLLDYPLMPWFSSFLNGRQQCRNLHFERQRSSWQTTKSGIPEGTVLGPTLFLININDLPDCIRNDYRYLQMTQLCMPLDCLTIRIRPP